MDMVVWGLFELPSRVRTTPEARSEIALGTFGGGEGGRGIENLVLVGIRLLTAVHGRRSLHVQDIA